MINDDCIYYHVKVGIESCDEKHHLCHINPEECSKCQYRETWYFPEKYRKENSIIRKGLKERRNA